MTNDAVSDWLPLGVLVRTPAIQQVSCPARATPRVLPTVSLSTASGEASGKPGDTATADLPCTLTGDDLFLIDSVSADAAFTSPVSLPEGYSQESVRVPRPADGHTLYLRLRDDPNHAASLSIDARTVANR